MQFTWIGWPGQDVSPPHLLSPQISRVPRLTSARTPRNQQIPMKDREQVEQHLLEEFNCYPVYLSDELADRHYNGFSNSILWPLFHYHPGEMNFDEDNWLAYR